MNFTAPRTLEVFVVSSRALNGGRSIVFWDFSMYFQQNENQRIFVCSVPLNETQIKKHKRVNVH